MAGLSSFRLHITRQNLTLQNVLPYILITAGIIGALASFVLTYDKIQVIQNPSYSPGCNINPVLSCVSIMSTEQASLMGVPNSIFGLVAFSMLLTFGVLLAAGARLRPWIWIAAQAAATVGVIFMHYLFFQGVYRIGAICPWCFVVWMITIPVFWYITMYNLQQRHIPLPARLEPARGFVLRHHGDILLVWYLIIFAILLHRFWYFWVTLVQ